MKGFKVVLSCGVAVAGLAWVHPALAQARTFDMPAMPAGKAIQTFAKQAGVDVIASGETLRGVTTSPVKGTVEVQDALNQILQGTPLKATKTGNDVYLIKSSPVAKKISYATYAEPLPAAAAPLPTPAEEPEAEEDMGLGEIVVTAQRREERLQDVPAAISAIGTEQIAAAGVMNTRDLQMVTPSISFTQSSYAPQPAIRGIGTRGVNPGDEQVVPIYIDGVYQPFVVGGLFELADVERVEVLRGPQGTLLGRNATGGAINIVTQAPKPGFGGKVTLGYGRFDQRQADGYITGGTETISGSLNAQYLEDDGYVYDITNRRTFGSIDSLTLRGKLRLAPTDSTTVTLTLGHSNRYDDTSLANYAMDGNTIGVRDRPDLVIATSNRKSSQDPGFAPRLRTKQDSAALTIVQKFGGFDLTSISSYADSDLSYDADVDMTPAVVSKLASDQYDHSFTQELFASSTTSGPFQWTAGLFYFNNKAGQNPRNLNGGLIFTKTHADAYAAYFQGSYDVTDRLRLTAGGRYSYDKKDAQAHNGPTITRVLPLVKKHWDSFDPTVSLDYKLDEKTRLYARYATAFKSGVFNATGFASDPVNPEEVESYEIGLKSDPARWLRINLAAFYTNYENIQILARSPDPANASAVLQNAANSKIKGLEGDITAKVARGLTLRASASYLDAKYDKFPNAQSLVRRPDGAGNLAVIIDASGNQLTRVPEFTGNVGFDYNTDFAGGTIAFGANAYYNSGYPWGVDDRITQGAHVLVNGQIAWTSASEALTVTLWGQNLSNSKPILTTSASVLGDQAAYFRPISYGVRVTSRF